MFVYLSICSSVYLVFCTSNPELNLELELDVAIWMLNSLVSWFWTKFYVVDDLSYLLASQLRHPSHSFNPLSPKLMRNMSNRWLV